MYLRRANPKDADAILSLWRMAEATKSITDTADDIRRISAMEHVAFILAIMDDSVVDQLLRRLMDGAGTCIDSQRIPFYPKIETVEAFFTLHPDNSS